MRSIRYKGYVAFSLLEGDAPLIVAVLHDRRDHAALDFSDRLEGD